MTGLEQSYMYSLQNIAKSTNEIATTLSSILKVIELDVNARVELEKTKLKRECMKDAAIELNETIRKVTERAERVLAH